MYVTGSGSSCSDLLGAVKSFAESNGWTTDHYAAGVEWSAHKGIAHVNFGVFTVNVNAYDGSGTLHVNTETYLRAAVSTSFSVTTYYGQPGSLSVNNTTTTGFDVSIGNLTGPFVEWFLFSGDGVSDPDYVHVVVQTGGETYCHFSFGLLDNKGLTHSGCAYIQGHNAVWFRNQSSLTDFSISFNRPSKQPLGFAGSNPGAGFIQGSSTIQGYAPDGFPNNANWPSTMFSHLSSAGKLTRLPLLVGADNPQGAFFSPANSLLDPVVMAQASTWSGYTVLWGIPLIVYETISTPNQYCYLGDFPNVRFLEMTGMVPQQELTIGTDVWKVFPVCRQENWATFEGANPSTGQYAYAYKKIP